MGLLDSVLGSVTGGNTAQAGTGGSLGGITDTRASIWVTRPTSYRRCFRG